MKQKRKIFGLSGRGGFTIPEVVVAASISIVIVAGTLGSYITVLQTWRYISMRMLADREVNLAMTRLVYGSEGRRGMRSARGVTLDGNKNGNWTVSYSIGTAVPPEENSITYSKSDRTLTFNPGNIILLRNISLAEAEVSERLLTVKLQVERSRGGRTVRREIETRVTWRN